MRRSAALCWLAGGLLVGCGGGAKVAGPPPPPTIPQLTLIETHALTIPEPSDVAIGEAGMSLWMVGNHPERVYQLDLSGVLIRELPYDGHDLEGVAFDSRDRTLWVAEENRREVVHLDTDGGVLSRNALGLTGELNSGLEGICLGDGGHVFVLNEKLPGMFIDLDLVLTIASEDTLHFASDYSGMTYDPQRACYWITSDESERLFLWSKAGGVAAEYLLPFPKPEGVALDPASHRIYVVSDSTKTLYVYQAPAGSVATRAR